MSAPIDTATLAAEVAALVDKPAPPLLDDDQAGDLLCVPASWMLAQARAGRVPHVKLGHYVRFKRDELLAWVEARTTGPRPKAPR